MISLKSALSSILVVLGACDRAAEGSPSAVSRADHTTIASARPSPSASPHPAVKPMGSRDGAKTVYVCPMHPEVVSDTPGLCPKCNMKLDPKPQATETRPAEGRQNSPRAP